MEFQYDQAIIPDTSLRAPAGCRCRGAGAGSLCRRHGEGDEALRRHQVRACSSTGASTPSPPASGRASTSAASASGSCSARRSRWPSTGNWPKQFNPVKFNADEWAQLAKDAGMKYMVITSKHHDGFAMFKSSGVQVQHRGCHALRQGSDEGPLGRLRQARPRLRLLLLAGPGLARSRRPRQQLGLSRKARRPALPRTARCSRR